MKQRARVVLAFAASIVVASVVAQDAVAGTARVTGVRVSADRHTIYVIDSNARKRAVAHTCDANTTVVPLDARTLAETLSPSGRWISTDVFTKTNAANGGVQTTWFIATADGALVRTRDFPAAFGARPVARSTTELWNRLRRQTLSYGSQARPGDAAERVTLDFPDEPRTYPRARCLGKG